MIFANHFCQRRAITSPRRLDAYASSASSYMRIGIVRQLRAPAIMTENLDDARNRIGGLLISRMDSRHITCQVQTKPKQYAEEKVNAL